MGDAAASRRERMEVTIYPSLSAQDRDDAGYRAAMPVRDRVR